MNKSRWIAWPLSILMMAGVCTGCSGGTGKKATSSASGKSNAAATISICYRDDGTGAKGTWWRWLENSGKALKDKNITVKMAPITASEGDYFSKIALQLKSGDNCPDVVCEDTFMIASDANAGYLTALDNRVSGWSDWTGSSFYDSLKKGAQGADGKTYGVPFCTDTRGLWYNKDLFKKAGLDENWSPKTWDDVLSTARTLKKKLPDVVPFWMNSGKATGEATSMQTYEMLLYGTGERLLNSDNKWIIKSQGITDSLNFIQTIYNEKLGPPLSKVLNGQAGNTEARQYFPQGKLAIALDGSWISSNWMKGGQAEWSGYDKTMGFTAMPTKDGSNGGTITLAGGWTLAIPTKAKSPDAAWEFIKVAANKENMLWVDINGGNITARTDVAADSQYTSTPFNDIATNFLKTAQFRPKDDKYSSVSTCIQTMVESVVSGTKVADAVQKYGEDVTRVVGSGNVVSQ
jgi:multiple sugar transport system substrate-binding protein